MTLWLFSILLIFYFALHSFLADARSKSLVTGKLFPKKYYRLVYNLLAIGLLFPLAFAYFQLDKNTIITAEWVMIPGGVLTVSGIIWGWKSMKSYDLSEFTGIYQWRYGHPPEHTELVTSGLNRYVRHPLYFGTLLIIWGAFLCFPNDASLAIATITTAYLYVGTLLEEKKLTQQFGKSYRLYQEKVPMLIPFCTRQKKK